MRRVNYLLKDVEEPGAHSLGMKLALLMAAELQEGKALGSATSGLVTEWMEKYPHSIVEEAINYARQFLIKPQSLTESLSNKLWEDSKPDE